MASTVSTTLEVAITADGGTSSAAALSSAYLDVTSSIGTVGEGTWITPGMKTDKQSRNN